MFIIEKLKRDLEEREKAWERARDKWVYEKSYRSRYDYESMHPRPGHYGKVIVRGLVLGIMISGLTFMIFMAVKGSAEEGKSQEVAQEVNNCKRFNKGDHVRIQYGDYKGVAGKIIGGCEEYENYQVDIDEGEKVNFPNDGNVEVVDVGEKTIAVNSYENLVVIEEESKNE